MKYKHLFVLTPIKGEKLFRDVFYNSNDTFDRNQLTDKQYAVPLPKTGTFELKNFKNTHEMSEEIAKSIGGAKKFWNYDAIGSLWKWLTLVLHDKILQDDPQGGKRYGESVRYDPAIWTDYLKATRHTVRGALFLYARLGHDDSEFLLQAELNMTQEIREQVSQTALLVQPGIAGVFRRLYWDDKKKVLRKGHANQQEGDCRDLVRVVKQLMVTYAIEQMDTDEIIELLPDYFSQRWLV